jgi:hypothetical protein
MYIHVLLCCSVMCRERTCDEPIPYPKSPTKLLNEFIVSEVNSKAKRVRGSNLWN